jgi:transposase
MRDGAEYFTEPASAAQRRYEALRAYFTDEMSAAEAADRFGYSTASIHQMATLLRKGRLNLFTGTRPGPKGPRKATGTPRARVLELRGAGHSVTPRRALPWEARPARPRRPSRAAGDHPGQRGSSDSLALLRYCPGLQVARLAAASRSASALISPPSSTAIPVR